MTPTRLFPLRTALRRAVPPLAGWNSFRSAYLNVLLLGLAGLGGEWLLHQTAYAVQYGSRFDAVMAGTSHHLYMNPLGAVLGVLLLAAALLSASYVVVSVREQRRLARSLPSRVARRVQPSAPGVPSRQVLATAVVLFVFQALAYGLQENLEGLAALGNPGGLAVVLSAQHAAVLPLDALIALIGAWTLWASATRLRRADLRLRITRRLLALFSARDVPLMVQAAAGLAPTRRVVAGSVGLRAPPATA